jgi:hypothetical protein
MINYMIEIVNKIKGQYIFVYIFVSSVAMLTSQRKLLMHIIVIAFSGIYIYLCSFLYIQSTPCVARFLSWFFAWSLVAHSDKNVDPYEK